MLNSALSCSRLMGVFPHRIPAFLFLLILSTLFCRPYSSHATEEGGEASEEHASSSIVFVIDVSTSMYDIKDELKRALSQYIRESEPGQSIAIVAFGTSSRLHYRRTIRGPEDIKRMLKFCDELQCEDEYTYIPGGLDAGIKELQRFYEKDPSGVHNLVLLSDGRNNPPKDMDQDQMATYEAIKEEYFSEFAPGKDWYISYVSLKGLPDSGLKGFVNECRGYTMALQLDKEYDDVNGEKYPDGTGRPAGLLKRMSISEVEIRPGREMIIDDSSVLDLGCALLPCRKKISIQVFPRKGNPSGQRFSVEPVFSDAITGAKVFAEILPSEIMCGREPKEEELILLLDGSLNNMVSGALLFKPVEKSIFIVHPTQLIFQLWPPPKFVIGTYRAELDHDYTPIERLTLGPLEPGGQCVKKLALKLEGRRLPGDVNIQATHNLRLPDGVTCDLEANLGGLLEKSAYIQILATASEDAVLSDGRPYRGDLILENPEAEISFSQASIPLQILTPRIDKTEFNWKALLFLVIIPALLLGSVAIFGYVRFKAYMNRFVASEGWLILLENPVGDKVNNIDLEELSRNLKKKTLIIGRDPASDIRLPHKSVEKEHAMMRPGREGTPTPMYIRRVGISDIKINGSTADEETMLRDRDIVTIGDFQFLYSNSHMKQVVVHFKNGQVKQGVPLTWDIAEKDFMLQPEGKEAEEMPLRVAFNDLKAVFFVKAFDKEIARKMKLSVIYAKKQHVIIKFRDGEKIEGYTMQKYDSKSSRFFITPKVEPEQYENNIAILVEKSFTKRVKVISEHETD